MILLEREAQLEQLAAALEQTSAAGRVALVSGEAGIGKTSLIRRFSELHESSHTFLWGGCDPQLNPKPLSLFYDIARTARPELLPLLAHGVDWLAVASAFLSDLAGSSLPIIVVFEDIHWADEASLDFIKYIGRRIQQTQALLILTFRDDEVGAAHPLRSVLGVLVQTGQVCRVSLPPLSPAGVETLAKGKSIDHRALHSQTGGNPFYVTEALAAGLPQHAIPESVRDAVLGRAAHLSPSGRAVLECAAVIGHRIEVWLLNQIAGAEAEATTECIEAGMLLPDPEARGEMLKFRHELAWNTILSSISPQRKLVLNRLILTELLHSALTQHDLARLARHAEAAADVDAVLEYAPAAARRAAAVSAHREAAAQYGRALRFSAGLPPGERARLLEDYANEQAIIGRMEDAAALIEQAIQIYQNINELQRMGQAQAALALYLLRAGHNGRAEAIIQHALQALSESPASCELVTAYEVMTSMRMLDQDYAGTIAWGSKTIELAQAYQNQPALAGVYNSMGAVMLLHGDEQGRAYLEKSIAMFLNLKNDHGVALGYSNLASGHGEIFRLGEADRYLEAAEAFCLEHELDQPLSYVLAWKALVRLYQGRWAEAGEAATAALATPGAMAITRINTLAALGRLRARRGDPGVMLALDEALALAAATGTLQRLAPVGLARAEAAFLAGNPAAAAKEAAAIYPLALERRHRWFAGEAAYWMWRSGQGIEPADWIAAPYALEIHGDWQAAANTWEQIGCPYEQGRALAGGAPAARLRALEIFTSLGAEPAIQVLRHTLRTERTPGVPRGPRPATRGNPYGLTARQMDILALLAAGAGNAEIAGRLSLSTRTVEHHVAAVLAKLNARTRAEAAALALQNGLIGLGEKQN